MFTGHQFVLKMPVRSSVDAKALLSGDGYKERLCAAELHRIYITNYIQHLGLTPNTSLVRRMSKEIPRVTVSCVMSREGASKYLFVVKPVRNDSDASRPTSKRTHVRTHRGRKAKPTTPSADELMYAERVLHHNRDVRYATSLRLRHEGQAIEVEEDSSGSPKKETKDTKHPNKSQESKATQDTNADKNTANDADVSQNTAVGNAPATAVRPSSPSEFLSAVIKWQVAQFDEYLLSQGSGDDHMGANDVVNIKPFVATEAGLDSLTEAPLNAPEVTLRGPATVHSLLQTYVSRWLKENKSSKRTNAKTGSAHSKSGRSQALKKRGRNHKKSSTGGPKRPPFYKTADKTGPTVLSAFDSGRRARTRHALGTDFAVGLTDTAISAATENAELISTPSSAPKQIKKTLSVDGDGAVLAMVRSALVYNSVLFGIDMRQAVLHGVGVANGNDNYDMERREGGRRGETIQNDKTKALISRFANLRAQKLGGNVLLPYVTTLFEYIPHHLVSANAVAVRPVLALDPSLAVEHLTIENDNNGRDSALTEVTIGGGPNGFRLQVSPPGQNGDDEMNGSHSSETHAQAGGLTEPQTYLERQRGLQHWQSQKSPGHLNPTNEQQSPDGIKQTESVTVRMEAVLPPFADARLGGVDGSTLMSPRSLQMTPAESPRHTPGNMLQNGSSTLRIGGATNTGLRSNARLLRSVLGSPSLNRKSAQDAQRSLPNNGIVYFPPGQPALPMESAPVSEDGKDGDIAEDKEQPTKEDFKKTWQGVRSVTCCNRVQYEGAWQFIRFDCFNRVQTYRMASAPKAAGLRRIAQLRHFRSSLRTYLRTDSTVRTLSERDSSGFGLYVHYYLREFARQFPEYVVDLSSIGGSLLRGVNIDDKQKMFQHSSTADDPDSPARYKPRSPVNEFLSVMEWLRIESSLTGVSYEAQFREYSIDQLESPPVALPARICQLQAQFVSAFPYYRFTSWASRTSTQNKARVTKEQSWNMNKLSTPKHVNTISEAARHHRARSRRRSELLKQGLDSQSIRAMLDGDMQAERTNPAPKGSSKARQVSGVARSRFDFITFLYHSTHKKVLQLISLLTHYLYWRLFGASFSTVPKLTEDDMALIIRSIKTTFYECRMLLRKPAPSSFFWPSLKDMSKLCMEPTDDHVPDRSVRFADFKSSPPPRVRVSLNTSGQLDGFQRPVRCVHNFSIFALPLLCDGIISSVTRVLIACYPGWFESKLGPLTETLISRLILELLEQSHFIEQVSSDGKFSLRSRKHSSTADHPMAPFQLGTSGVHKKNGAGQGRPDREIGALTSRRARQRRSQGLSVSPIDTSSVAQAEPHVRCKTVQGVTLPKDVSGLPLNGNRNAAGATKSTSNQKARSGRKRAAKTAIREAYDTLPFLRGVGESVQDHAVVGSTQRLLARKEEKKRLGAIRRKRNRRFEDARTVSRPTPNHIINGTLPSPTAHRTEDPSGPVQSDTTDQDIARVHEGIRGLRAGISHLVRSDQGFYQVSWPVKQFLKDGSLSDGTRKVRKASELRRLFRSVKLRRKRDVINRARRAKGLPPLGMRAVCSQLEVPASEVMSAVESQAEDNASASGVDTSATTLASRLEALMPEFHGGKADTDTLGELEVNEIGERVLTGSDVMGGVGSQSLLSSFHQKPDQGWLHNRDVQHYLSLRSGHAESRGSYRSGETSGAPSGRISRQDQELSSPMFSIAGAGDIEGLKIMLPSQIRSDFLPDSRSDSANNSRTGSRAESRIGYRGEMRAESRRSDVEMYDPRVGGKKTMSDAIARMTKLGRVMIHRHHHHHHHHHRHHHRDSGRHSEFGSLQIHHGHRSFDNGERGVYVSNVDIDRPRVLIQGSMVANAQDLFGRGSRGGFDSSDVGVFGEKPLRAHSRETLARMPRMRGSELMSVQLSSPLSDGTNNMRSSLAASQRMLEASIRGLVSPLARRDFSHGPTSPDSDKNGLLSPSLDEVDYGRSSPGRVRRLSFRNRSRAVSTDELLSPMSVPTGSISPVSQDREPAEIVALPEISLEKVVDNEQVVAGELTAEEICNDLMRALHHDF